MNKRVMLLVSTFEGFGTARVMYILGCELIGLGYDPYFLATYGPASSPLADQARAAGMEIGSLEMRSMWDPSGLRRFAAIVQEWKPAVVHTRTVRADIISRAAARHGAHVINNIVNLYPDDSLTWHGPVKGRVVVGLARATTGPVRMFVANAHAIVPAMQRTFKIPDEKVRVIHDGIVLGEWTGVAPADLTEFGLTSRHDVCLTVARLHPQKGLTDLIEAAAGILDVRPETRFLIVGEGEQRAALEARVLEAGLEELVVLAGWRQNIPALMAASDIFVLPSRFEGLPNSVIEAMASRLPVVATAVAGTPELVEEGVTGWLVPSSNPDALAARVLTALDSDREEIGAAGQARAHKHFSSAAMAGSFARLYEELDERREASGLTGNY